MITSQTSASGAAPTARKIAPHEQLPWAGCSFAALTTVSTSVHRALSTRQTAIAATPTTRTSRRGTPSALELTGVLRWHRSERAQAREARYHDVDVACCQEVGSMTRRSALNDRQLRVLQRIAAGVEAVSSAEPELATTVYALTEPTTGRNHPRCGWLDRPDHRRRPLLPPRRPTPRRTDHRTSPTTRVFAPRDRGSGPVHPNSAGTDVDWR